MVSPETAIIVTTDCALGQLAECLDTPPSFAGLEQLLLIKVDVCDSGPGWRPFLPKVANILLSDVVFCERAAPFDNTHGAAALLSPAVLPGATTLRLHTDLSYTEPTGARVGAEFAAFLGQVKTLRIEGYYPAWLVHQLVPFNASLRRLEHLALATSDAAIQRTLGLLPAPLRTLDLSPPPAQKVSRLRREVPFEWIEGWEGVKELERLVLPARERWIDHPKATMPAKWFAQVEAAARKQGADIEFR